MEPTSAEFRKVILILLLLGTVLQYSCEPQQEDRAASFKTHFESSGGEETATYLQVIDFYIRLAKEFPQINMQTVGETDSGYPLHIITYNPDMDFNFQKIRNDKVLMLINNGIHPGESDGIDATMLLYRDLATGKLKTPKQTVLVTIPLYNVGGALNRNSTSRANQNGPKSYGFRGNTLNYDLNRDFIKADTKNARTFFRIYHLVKPDVFVDNHVSNGADYQYTLTHLFTQHDKLGQELGNYLNQEMMPSLEQALAEDDWIISPYVNVFNTVPEKGFSQFMDYPRYSTGYTTLWNTLGMMVETHMLKPYRQRVEGNYELMKKMIDITEADNKKIKRIRAEAKQRHKGWKYYPTAWAIDSTQKTELNFKGFEADTLTSEVTGFTRLKYNQDSSFTRSIEYLNFFRPIDSVEIPKAYILKQGWSEVTELLDLNEIEYETIQKDTLLEVESYRIGTFSTLDYPYEGHYPHYDTEVDASLKKVKFQQGDYFIATDQVGIRYLLETLEPEAKDSFFNWNFFDTILTQKEGFSPYVFEDEALRLLQENPNLKNRFESKKTSEPEFAANWYAQLNWLFKQSEHYEDAHLQYPVYRLLKSM